MKLHVDFLLYDQQSFYDIIFKVFLETCHVTDNRQMQLDIGLF